MTRQEIRFGRVVVRVPDLGAAADAYRSAFGWTTIFDAEGPGGRYLHVGPAGQPGVGVWFLASSDAPAEEPLLVLYADDLDAATVQAVAAGMRTVGAAGASGGGRHRHLLDPFGHRLVLVELRDAGETP